MTITRVHHLNSGTMRPLGRQLSALMPRAHDRAEFDRLAATSGFSG